MLREWLFTVDDKGQDKQTWCVKTLGFCIFFPVFLKGYMILCFVCVHWSSPQAPGRKGVRGIVGERVKFHFPRHARLPPVLQLERKKATTLNRE